MSEEAANLGLVIFETAGAVLLIAIAIAVAILVLKRLVWKAYND